MTIVEGFKHMNKTGVPQQCFTYIANDYAYLTHFDLISDHISNTYITNSFRKSGLH